MEFVGVSDFTLGLLVETFDDESDIIRSTWCLGSFPGACDAGDKVEIDDHRRGEESRSVAGLTDGVTYYSLFTSYNGAGNYQFVVTDGFRVDLKAPYCGVVMDGASYDRQAIGPSSLQYGMSVGDYEYVGELPVSWYGMVDYGSGIKGHLAAIVSENTTAPGPNMSSVSVWTGPLPALSGSTYHLCRLTHATRYYSVDLVYDRLGNERLCFSDGFMFDATPPDVTNARLSNALATNPKYQSLQRVSHLHGVRGDRGRADGAEQLARRLRHAGCRVAQH